MKLIFLDIDGVLNDHTFNEEAQSSTIDEDSVDALNEVIHKTGAVIVLSSAWRYQVLNGAMTFIGFEYLLRTHGVTNDLKIVGSTRRDYEDYKNDLRGNQISEWMKRESGIVCRRGSPILDPVESYVVLDDGGKDEKTGKWTDLGLSVHPWVRTHGNFGLTQNEASMAITILNEVSPRIVEVPS